MSNNCLEQYQNSFSKDKKETRAKVKVPAKDVSHQVLLQCKLSDRETERERSRKNIAVYLVYKFIVLIA